MDETIQNIPPTGTSGFGARITVSVASVLLLGSLATLTAAWLVRDSESEAAVSQFQLSVADEVSAIQREIEANLDVLRSVAAFYDASELVTRGEFMLFTRPLIKRRRSIEAIEWIPRVRPGERAAFTESVRAEGIADFEIRRIAPSVDNLDTDAFPIVFVEPIAELRPILGFDLASEPVRRATIERARDSGRSAATPQLRLVQNSAAGVGFLVFVPVYGRGMQIETPAERANALTGFVVGVFHPEEIIAEALQYLQSGGNFIRIYDDTDPSESVLLLTHGRPDAGSGMDPVSHELEFSGRRWRIVFTPSGPGHPQSLSRTVLGVLAAGVMLTLFAAFSLGGHLGRTHRVERVVAQRTLDLRATAEALRESDRRMRSILDYSSSVIFIKDREGRYAVINRRYETLFHLKAEEYIGRTDYDIFPESVARALRANDRQIMESGEATEFEEIVTQGGESRTYLSVKIPLRHDDGSIYGVCGIATDITERKRAEEFLAASRDELEVRVAERTLELHQSERIMSTLLSNLPGAAYRCRNDADWTMEFISGGIQSLTGHAPDDYTSGRVSLGADVVHPDDQSRIWDEVQQALAAREPFRLVYRIRTRGGSEKWVWEQGRGIFSPSGELDALEGFMTDMTELKNAEDAIHSLNEELEERIEQRTRDLKLALTELEAFSYSVSHDLRAPLRAIDGFSLALSEDCDDRLDDEGRAHLQRVRQACQRMGHLIDDLLALSRVTRADLTRSPVDLSAIARGVADNLREISPNREADITIQPSLHAEADPRLLQIALENLLGNAWKFTGQRARARIEVGCATDPPPPPGRDHVPPGPVFFVRDNGAGFDMQFASKLFGVFQRFHSNSEFPGTGIGLATVQRIVHRHGGEIWCESVPDGGAVFYFTLSSEPAAVRAPAHA